MLIKEDKKQFSLFYYFINKKFIKDISVKKILFIIILIQFVIILIFFIFLVPHWSGFYKVESEYNKQNIFVRKILSLKYITRSIFSSAKLRLGLIDSDLNIYMSPSNYAELMTLRNKGYELIKTAENNKTTLENTSNYKLKKYFNANFVTNDKNLVGKLRLKGEQSTHYQEGKWSMKVQLKNNSFMGMNSFHLQHPKRRSYLSSYILHLFNKFENLPTKKFGLITLAINDNPIGLYNFEELPTKEASLEMFGEERLPVFLNDNFYKGEGVTNNSFVYNEYKSTNLRTYNQEKTLLNPIFMNDFENATKLLYDFRSKRKKTLEVFDEKTAAFLALIDLFGGLHTMMGFNTRFYYDRNTKKLTPTLWDAFSENTAFVGGVDYGGGDRNFSLALSKEAKKIFFDDLFRDQKFLEKYLIQLNKFCDLDYINKVINFYKKDIQKYLDKLLPFYPQASLDTEINRLRQNINYLNKAYLKAKNPVIIYRSKNNSNNSLVVINRKPYPIFVKSLIIRNNKQEKFVNKSQEKIFIKGWHYEDPIQQTIIKFDCPNDDCFGNNDINDFEILITKLGQTKILPIKINNQRFNSTDNL